MRGPESFDAETPTRRALSQESGECLQLLLGSVALYMSVGAETWYRLCEQLRAEITYKYDLPPLTVRLRRDVDVNMADTPTVGTPSAGKKRSRDDDVDANVFELEMRYEKVGDAVVIFAEKSIADAIDRKHVLVLLTVTHGPKTPFSTRQLHLQYPGLIKGPNTTATTSPQ